MSDYSQGKIYKLYVPGLEDNCYIGSTYNTLYHRYAQHKYAAKLDSQKKCAASQMFQDGNEVVIELIENFPCNSKQELEVRERYWLEQFPEAINTNTPTRTWKERWEANKEHNLQKHKDWIAANKDKQAEYKKQKRLENLELAKQKDKEARERRKEKIAAAKAEIVECPICQSKMRKGSLWTHTNTVHKK